jgi:hypothetical protein
MSRGRRTSNPEVRDEAYTEVRAPRDGGEVVMGWGEAPFASSDDGRVDIRELWNHEATGYEVLLTTFDKDGNAISRVDAGELRADHVFDTYEEALHVAARLTDSTIRYAWNLGGEGEPPILDPGRGLVLAEGGRVHWPNIQRLRQRDVDLFNAAAKVAK